MKKIKQFIYEMSVQRCDRCRNFYPENYKKSVYGYCTHKKHRVNYTGYPCCKFEKYTLLDRLARALREV